MSPSARSTTPLFVVAAVSLLLAVVTGVAWLGTPLRPVRLLTIIGLGMGAGASWAQAVWRAREERTRRRRREETVPAAGA